VPLLFDMPRAQLETYQGSTPRPADFDEYWADGLAELAAIDPAAHTTPASFQTPFARCSDLWFTGTHGAKIHARLVEPDPAPSQPGPAVLMFHGLSGRAPDWSGMLAYAAAGITVAALDCRGQGGESDDAGGVPGWTLRGHIMRGLPDDPARAYYRQVYLDTKQLARVVFEMDTVDETRVGATGGSQGGGLTLACASLEPRIARAAAVFPYLCDYKRVWDLELAKNAYADIEDWFRRFDPLHEREDEVFTKLGYIDVAQLTPWIEAEVLMSTGFEDRVCPPSTQFAAYNKITSKKSLRAYPDFGHEGLPANEDAVFSFLLGL
jgi:cephalosporin-C deacetylase